MFTIFNLSQIDLILPKNHGNTIEIIPPQCHQTCFAMFDFPSENPKIHQIRRGSGGARGTPKSSEVVSAVFGSFGRFHGTSWKSHGKWMGNGWQMH